MGLESAGTEGEPQQPTGDGASVLIVPSSFQADLNSIFGPSDMVRVEGMCWMLAERGDARRVAQLVMTEHEGTNDTCTSTGSGDVALVRFLTDRPRLMVVGWAHSHHTEHLSTPNAADVAQQWRLHVSVDPAFAMVINWRRGLQPNDGHACWRLAPSCVMELAAARGVVNTRAATPSSYLVPVPLHYEEYVMPLVWGGLYAWVVFG